jgi:hypothetical protein
MLTMGDAPRPLHYIDGWYTDDPEEFRQATQGAKSWSYWSQVRVDLRSWKVWLLWLSGLAWPVAGLVIRSLPLAALGVFMAAFVLHKYVHMLRRVVSGLRASVLVEGVVARFDTRHPLFRGHLAGELKQTAIAHERVMALLPAWVVQAHARPGGSMEVLVSHPPGADFSQVVGFRRP